MTISYNERGFVATDPIASSYGGTIRVQESSSAEHARVWIFCKSPTDLNQWAQYGDEGVADWQDACAHLSLEDAERFANNILEVVRNHRMNVSEEDESTST